MTGTTGNVTPLRKMHPPATVRSIARLAVRLAKENPLYVDPGIMWSLAAD
jgi:hypothetical protein